MQHIFKGGYTMQQSKRCDKNDGETDIEELQYLVHVNLCVQSKEPIINY